MNPDKPSREQIEARITALLLGELPAEEAELLRWTISQDPELQKLHARLLLTVGLVHEAIAHPADADEKSAPMKFSDERREQLLAHFKTPRPEFVMPVNRGKSFWVKQLQPPSLINLLVVVAIVALLAAMLLPALSSSKSKAMRASALNTAKQKALEEQIRAEDNSTASAPAQQPVALTPLPPEPTVAPPPPAEIVLPKTESSPAAGTVYPATMFGYANVPNNSVAVFGSGSAGAGGGVSFGGGGFAEAQNSGEAQPRGSANSLDTFALKAGGDRSGVEDQTRRIGGAITGPLSGAGDNLNVATADSLGVANGGAPTGSFSTRNSLDDLNTPQNLGGEFRRKVPAATAAPSYTFSAENTVASTAPVNKKDSDQDFAGYLGAKQTDAKPSPDTSDYQIAVQRNWQPQPSRSATDAESKKVPFLGDLPASGRLFQTKSGTSTVEAFDTTAPAATPSAPGGSFQQRLAGIENRAASPATAGGDVMLEFSGKGESAKFDNGTLTLNGNNSFADGTTVNAGRISSINGVVVPGQTITVNSGVTRDDANGLRYLFETNNVALADSEKKPTQMHATVNQMVVQQPASDEDKSLLKAQLPPPIPQPEVLTRENSFSTFSLNVSDVSFKLAEASLEKGKLPDAASIRSEEFINAFDYRDPEAKWDSASSLSAQTGKMPVPQPVAFASERARYPFAHNRDLLRFSVKTAAAGRPAGRALNLVLLLDTSGSMERADRVAIIREALRVLATQLQPQDTVSVVTFARTARLWADGVSGDKAGETLSQVGGITPDGGTNLEEAMRLAYETARRHYLANGMNRVVLLTDGAANLGNVDPNVLKQKVEAQRKQGIALDCFGIGFEDFNDDLLEQLSSNGDGRYAFLNSPEDASKEFAAKLAGALQVAAQDVKVQVEFNPQRVISWRQIGYAKHQLTKKQFRDNTVDAAEIAAQEAGNALYTVETKPDGVGPVATVRVRYKVPGTTDYRERSWNVDYAAAPALEQSSAAMRLAATASAFSEWLAISPFAQEVTLDELQKILNGVPQVYGADQRPAKLETMIREARSVSGK